METSDWSSLPPDMLGSIFQRLSLADFHRAKIVCSNWNSSSKLTLSRKRESPWLILFPDSYDVCMLYNPEEDRVYRTNKELSGTRFLANYGNWLLMLDSTSNLYMIDLFSENRIDLPPLESLISSTYSLKRVGDHKEFIREHTSGGFYSIMSTDDLRGHLWVNDKAKEFVVAWYVDCSPSYLCFCKRGDLGYTVIPLRYEVLELFNGLIDLVLRGDRLYIVTTRHYIRVIDLSGQQGFKDVTGSPPSVMRSRSGVECCCNIAVTRAGEVLLVETTTRNVENGRRFRLYKMDPEADPDDYYHADLVEVDSLGDEALLLDLGTTVAAAANDHTLGFEPNSIYFTQHYRPRLRVPYKLDICVFNLATKTLKRFPDLAYLNLKDARWFLPVT